MSPKEADELAAMLLEILTSDEIFVDNNGDIVPFEIVVEEALRFAREAYNATLNQRAKIRERIYAYL